MDNEVHLVCFLFDKTSLSICGALFPMMRLLACVLVPSIPKVVTCLSQFKRTVNVQYICLKDEAVRSIYNTLEFVRIIFISFAFFITRPRRRYHSFFDSKHYSVVIQSLNMWRYGWVQNDSVPYHRMRSVLFPFHIMIAMKQSSVRTSQRNAQV